MPGPSWATVSTERDPENVDRCVTCGQTFSATKGTPYYRLQYRRARFDAVVALRVEGVSISAIARVEGIAWNTVARWLEHAADVCRGFNQSRMAGFVVEELQADEIRSFVGGKTRPTWIFVGVHDPLKRFSNRPCTTWGGRGTSAHTDAGGPMRAYSMDLRERALLDSDAGMKAADVAAKYRVSGSWVRLLKQRRRETGEVAPRVQRHGRRGMLEPHLHTLAALIAAQPDRTLAELKDALATPASVPTVWGSSLGFPGALLRLDPGANPPQTALTEIYELPWGNPRAAVQGYSPRGMDIDRNGVVWTPLASGHLASFDRSKCTGPLNGPTATGQHCPEGWTLYEEPLPQLKGLSDSGSAEASSYTWVDQFDTFGLGSNVPINTGNVSEALLALVDEAWVVMRVPYPLGFYTKWLDGRIDDPNAGWKGKGLWATWGTRAPFHGETGKGTTSKVVHFQLRPDPLAK